MTMINQDELFGKATKAFTVATLMKTSEEDKKNKDFNFTKTKQYFLSYFAKSISDARYFYEPQEVGEGLIENMTSLQMDKTLKQIPVITYTTGDGEDTKSKKFNIAKWFIEQHYTTYSIASDPRSNRFYESQKTGRKYINLSKGFLHKNPKKFAEFPVKIKSNVERINNHILNIWNSGNKEAGEYCLNWLSHALTGHKQDTALFLKSGEGAGKTVIVDFFNQFVIGSALGLLTARPKQLMTFNAQLLGKIFLVLEELPASSKNEWCSISDFLKDLITGSSIDIEKKYADIIQTVNLISLIIITNNESTVKFGKDIRRYFFADISHDKVGDSEYFKSLGQCCDRETGEAYYSWLLERYEQTKDSFHCENIPLTQSKIEMKIKNLTPLLKYVKEEYIMNKTGLIDSSKKHNMIELSSMKDVINVNENKTVYKSTQALNSALQQDLPIAKIEIAGKNKTPHIKPVDFDTLYQWYVKKGFWNTTFDRFKCEDEDDDNTNEDIKKSDYKVLYEEQINKNITYEKQIKELQEQIKLLQQTQKIEKPVEIKTPVKSKIVLDDLENDLLELEKESEIKATPKKTIKTTRTKIIKDDEIEFEISQSSNIDNFFN
jgi:hypothetical protein